MNKIVRKDILAVLSRAIDILEKQDEADSLSVKELSNALTHSSSIFYDEDAASVAILMYAMAKLIARGLEDVHYNKIFSHLVSAKNHLEKRETEVYRTRIKGIFDTLRKADKELNLYIQEVIEEAQIKKGSSIYSHGISSANVAALLGISQWELLSYIGKTAVTDEPFKVTDVRRRLSLARRLFT